MDKANISQPVEVPGEPKHTATSLRETATATIQAFGPLKKIHQHLCAFHFYADDMTRQVEAHHYCGHLNEEMRQCLIYDRPGTDARLIGIEYIVTDQIFKTLPDEEKPMWHSHEYEVKSGVLFMPGVPGPVQRMDLEKLPGHMGRRSISGRRIKGTTFPLVCLKCHIPYGLERHVRFPLGANKNFSLTRDGQLYDNLGQDVEKRYGVSFAEERENREYMKGPENGIHPLANAVGKGLKTVLREADCKPVDTVPRVFI